MSVSFLRATRATSPGQRVIHALTASGRAAGACSVLRSWFGDERALAEVLDGTFDENVRAICASGSAFPARPDDSAWVAGQKAYSAIAGTPAAFLAQLAVAEEWAYWALMRNPTARVALWQSLVSAGSNESAR